MMLDIYIALMAGAVWIHLTVRDRMPFTYRYGIMTAAMVVAWFFT